MHLLLIDAQSLFFFFSWQRQDFIPETRLRGDVFTAWNQKLNRSWCAQRIPFQHQVLCRFPTLRDPGYVFSTLTVGEKGGGAAYSLLDVT